MVQQRLGDQWSELLSVAPGGHVHLDTMLDQRPLSGSRDWLPLIARAVVYLASVEGHWVVSMSLGECRRAPLEEVSIDTAFDLVETPEEFEPPAVNRLFEAMYLGASNDDHRVWSVATKERVTEAGVCCTDRWRDRYDAEVKAVAEFFGYAGQIDQLNAKIEVLVERQVETVVRLAESTDVNRAADTVCWPVSRVREAVTEQRRAAGAKPSRESDEL